MTFVNHSPHTVYVRLKWADPWVEAPHIYCNQVIQACSPRISQGRFWYRHGDIKQFGEDQWRKYLRQSYADHYIRVTYTSQQTGEQREWIGYIVRDSTERKGIQRPGAALDERLGDQTLTAYGMEYLLTRSTVRKSYVMPTEPWTRAAAQFRICGQRPAYRRRGRGWRLHVLPGL